MSDLLKALREEARAVVREELARLAGPRWLRCSAHGVSHKQRPSLEPEGVVFAKIGKCWFYDSATLDAYVERQRAAAASVNDATPADPLDALDPEVAAAVRRAVGAR